MSSKGSFEFWRIRNPWLFQKNVWVTQYEFCRIDLHYWMRWILINFKDSEKFQINGAKCSSNFKFSKMVTLGGDDGDNDNWYVKGSMYVFSQTMNDLSNI